MSRLFYLTLVGLVLAGIVHLLIILLIPSYATKDAWTRLAARSGVWSFTPVASPEVPVSVLPLVDPAFRMAACRFDLREAPLKLASDGVAPFWSVAIFDRQGRNIYSFNDRTAIERRLSALVVNPVQMARLRRIRRRMRKARYWWRRNPRKASSSCGCCKAIRVGARRPRISCATRGASNTHCRAIRLISGPALGPTPGLAQGMRKTKTATRSNRTADHHPPSNRRADTLSFHGKKSGLWLTAGKVSLAHNTGVLSVGKAPMTVAAHSPAVQPAVADQRPYPGPPCPRSKGANTMICCCWRQTGSASRATIRN